MVVERKARATTELGQLAFQVGAQRITLLPNIFMIIHVVYQFIIASQMDCFEGFFI